MATFAPIVTDDLQQLHARTEASPAADAEPAASPQSVSWNSRAITTTVGIIAAMAFGAALVSAVVLSGSMIILGFCVAFIMMLFIGMPLILASVADAVETHQPE